MRQLKMQAADGKYYQTVVADTEQLLRLIHIAGNEKTYHMLKRDPELSFNWVTFCPPLELMKPLQTVTA